MTSRKNHGVKQIAAAKFKETCLTLLDEVGPEGIVITKHGKPVARLIPFASDSSSLIVALAGKITIKGDIFDRGRLESDMSRHVSVPPPPATAAA